MDYWWWIHKRRRVDSVRACSRMERTRGIHGKERSTAQRATRITRTTVRHWAAITGVFCPTHVTHLTSPTSLPCHKLLLLGRLHMNDINELFKAHYILEYGEEEHKMVRLCTNHVIPSHKTYSHLQNPISRIFLRHPNQTSSMITELQNPGPLWMFSCRRLQIFGLT